MSTNEGQPLTRIVPATVHGRTLVRPPLSGAPRRWLVGFHGYAQTADALLESLRRVPGSDGWLIASVQALHPFYYGRTQQVVANWMTRLDREHAIADNVAYVDAVLADLTREFGAPSALVFAGFSQGVAMAYRAAVLGSRPSAAVLAVGGDLPPELKTRSDLKWPAVTICAGTRDEFYTPKRLAEDLDFFRSSGIGARAVAFDGGHEWSSAADVAAGRLLAEIAAVTGT
jgi:predicted esterase